jgi:hypothetical protein
MVRKNGIAVRNGYLLEIAAVFEGILVDTYLQLFLDYILSH